MIRAVPTLYSHSRLASFENCPRQFRYRYVDRIRVEVESIEAFMGKLVHAVVEKLNLVTASGQVPSLEAVLRRYHIMWDEGFDPERVRIVRGGTGPDLYRAIGARCTENFYRGHYPFDGEESLGIEEKVQFDLDAEGRYRMRGVVDRIVRARDGSVEIHDYKTGQRVPPQHVLDRDRQLALYQLGLGERAGDREVRLVWHYLATDRVRTSRRTPEQLEAVRAGTIDLIGRIEAERAYPARTGPLCRGCEFNDRCEEGRAHLGDAPPPPALVRETPAAPEPPAPPAEPPRERPGAQLALFS
jgi:putative RecB family exonuclease